MNVSAESGERGNAASSPDGRVSLQVVRTGVLVFYMLVLALNAVSLHRNNEYMPYGPTRTFWVAVSRPLARACEVLRLDRPRDWVTRSAGAALND